MVVSISVVIPLYNKSALIRKTLTGVVHQTYTPYEIIIVNDGSTDDSLLIAQDFLTEYPAIKIKTITQQNQGVSVARNTGILNASSDYVALLDADDEWDNEFLENMAYLIELFPEASMYSCAHRIKEM